MNLVLSSHFEKELRKLFKKNPEIKVKVNKTLGLMQTDLNYSSLRLHKLSGTNIWSVSVDMTLRIIFYWEKNSLYLIDIGKYDDVY